MRCDACNRDNPATARFCNACGEALALRCAACEQTNPPGSRFCNECGSRLEPEAVPERKDPRVYTPKHLAEKILHHKAGLEGERKHVTVLFADLAGSTAFAEAIDPEEMHALMDRAFQLILEEVHRYEGTVNQFTGDGVMALFGAPIALEDAPRRAVTAALGIQHALQSMDAEVHKRFDRDFRMRIGIHTGPVVVGTIGDDLRMDYTAVGDTTNLAARLEQLARPGSVVISETAQRLVSGFFDLRALPPASVKGKSRDVNAFEVIRARPVSSRIEASSESGLTRFVGRDREIGAIRNAFDLAAQGRGQVVFVVGDAGIGKSRLVHEFRRQLADTPHTWIEGRCASFARATPFYALADGLRRSFGIEDRDDEARAVERLERRESEVGGDLQWTLPFIRRLLSLPTGSDEVDSMEAVTRRSQTSRALRARFQRAAERRTLVVVIEDLHWVDTASEEFLAYLGDSIAATRVLLILTHRPGYQHPFGDRSFHVRIPVQALSESDTATMTEAVLETADLPTELRRIIASKAEGNPLFVEEVTQSLLEEGVLAIEEGRVRLCRDLANVTIPDRIQDVLMARLDRLPAEPKLAIQMASVIGREFALRLLERITETGERIDGIVGELRALELIYEKSSHPELAYMFKHALTHDVAYESVLVQRRKALHRIVGAAIEELYRDRLVEHYESLAYHFGEAEDWERTLHYHELASEKSEEAYANHAAIEHCRAALKIADRLAEPVAVERKRRIVTRLAECSWSISDFHRAGEAFLLSGRLAASPAERALATAHAGFCFVWAHDYERAAVVQAEAEALATESRADSAAAMALVVSDELELVNGRNLTDDSDIERAVRLAERANDPSVLISSLAQLAQRCEWRGDYRRAIEYAKRGVAMATKEHMSGSSVFSQWFLGMAYVAAGEYGNGLALLTRGIESCELIGDRAVKGRLLNTLGWAYAEFGCHDRAIEYNRISTGIAREMVHDGLVAGPELYANAAVNLAGSLLAQGDVEGAVLEMEPILAQMEHDTDAWMRWRYSLHVRDIQARILLASGDPEAALVLVDSELEGANGASAKKLQARALELRGRVLTVLERRDEAEDSVARALDVAVRIGYAPVTWRGLALSAELSRRAGNVRAAEDHLARARGVIEARAAVLPADDLRRELHRVGEQLLADPVADHR